MNDDRTPPATARRPKCAGAGRGAFLVVASLWAAAPRPALAAAGAPSLEGYTGQLTTPSAWIQEAGTAHLVFSNAPRQDPRTTRTYLVDVGLHRYLELAGRVTDTGYPAGIRDLSFNAKLQLPLDLLAGDLPIAIAVGTQDEGGAATHFQTRYAVASARLWRANASVGWGAGPQRLDGVFAGGALALLWGAEALAEWDTSNLNAGLRLSVPLDRIGVPVRLGGVAMTAVRSEPRRFSWGATLEVPLWLNANARGRTGPKDRARPVEPLAAERGAPRGDPEGAAASAPTPAAWTPAAEGEAPREADALAALEAALVEIGFEEVRVGRDGDVLVVEFENSVFNHAEADGVRVVSRELAVAGLDGPVALVLKQNGLRVAELRLARGAAPAEDGDGWTYQPRERSAAWASARPQNRRALHPALVLAPGLRTFVATELGVLDYLASFRPDMIVPFWPGATGFARFDVPFAWSGDLRDGGALRQFRNGPRVEYALAHQAMPVAGGLWAMVGGGVFRATDAGALGELLWTPGDGAIALGAQGSWTADDSRAQHRALTGSTRFRVPFLDVVTTVRAGRFVGGDRGATVQVARWFGDTQVGVFYTNTSVTMAGAFLTVPLTPRRDMRPGLLQVRGRRFGYDLGTVIGGGANTLTTGLGIAPMGPWNLEAAYLDDGRVTRNDLRRVARPAR